MKIVEFKPCSTDEALGVLDALRQDIVEGRIKAFAAVGLSEDHTTLAYAAQVKKTTRLELMGAIQHLQTCYSAGDV